MADLKNPVDPIVKKSMNGDSPHASEYANALADASSWIEEAVRLRADCLLSKRDTRWESSFATVELPIEVPRGDWFHSAHLRVFSTMAGYLEVSGR
ncbi:unnamed protein product [Dibothriocephalus latus]|uniref:Uncharacterized protein n=1 Tax=Dibothriocephalus latus TaxID=60516 RepID=A0A3P7P995_DIBLA|nr:unnamed protein product [Dibothriocephalus latus]